MLITASRAVSRHMLHSKVAPARARSQFGPSGAPSSSSAAAMARSVSPPRAPKSPQTHKYKPLQIRNRLQLTIVGEASRLFNHDWSECLPITQDAT